MLWYSSLYPLKLQTYFFLSLFPIKVLSSRRTMALVSLVDNDIHEVNMDVASFI